LPPNARVGQAAEIGHRYSGPRKLDQAKLFAIVTQASRGDTRGSRSSTTPEPVAVLLFSPPTGVS